MPQASLAAFPVQSLVVSELWITTSGHQFFLVHHIFQSPHCG